MSNLSNLYISESYYGVVNLIDSTEPFASQSEARIYLTDGLGENLGLSFNSVKRVSLDNGLTITGSLLVSGSKILTGSLDVQGDITASGTVRAGTGSFDTINARLIHTTIESSSVIYSTGSNILGDEPSDTQIFSGSVYVPNLHYLAGNAKDTNLRINEKLDTGSFNTFSSSISIEQIQQDNRLDSIEAFTASLVADFVTETELSAALETVTSSLQSQIDTKLDTGSFNTFSSSVSIEQNLQDSKLTNLINATSSYARVDTNNTFVGDNVFSGSVQGEVYVITPSSNTASIDCSQGNFFTLLHATSNNYLLRATNITGGRTITCRIKKTNPSATFTIDTGSIKFPSGFSYTITPGDEKEDVITFVSFDTGSLYAVASKNFV